MKKFFTAFFAVIFIFLFCSCNNSLNPELPEPESSKPVEIPSEPVSPVPEEEEPEEKEIPKICVDIVKSFGAMEGKDGYFFTPKGQPTAFDFGFFDDGAKASEDTYYFWTFHLYWNITEHYPFGERNGSCYDSDFFEEKIRIHFGAEPEYLRSLSIYSEEEDIYKREAEGMYFDAPLEITDYSIEENIVKICITRNLCDGETTEHSVLTVEILEDNGYKYLSYVENK